MFTARLRSIKFKKSMSARNVHFWLRAEQKPFEHRSLLLPQHVKELLKAGHQVTVEESTQRCVPIDGYKIKGVNIAKEGDWVNAPKETVILGLKELPEQDFPLVHTHIYFAHCFKGQSEAPQLLKRFKEGQGKLYDLEFLVDDSGRRIAAFGNAAGMVGMAVGVLAWHWSLTNKAPDAVHPPLMQTFPTFQELADFVNCTIGENSPKVLVVGALGRVGGGAVKMCELLGIHPTKWDIKETEGKKGPFPEILDFDVFANTINLPPNLPAEKRFRFLTPESIQDPKRKLRTITDVSCDPHNPANPIPIYKDTTSFSKPTLRIVKTENPLDIVSIDHFPSMVPAESSNEFANGLMPHLLQFAQTPVWTRALELFEKRKNEVVQ